MSTETAVDMMMLMVMMIVRMLVVMNALNDIVFHFPGTWRVMESTL